MKKFVSWNVNGLRACMEKGFMDAFRQLDADVFCLQETKLQQGQITLDLPGYCQYWNYAEKKGYSGTAVFTREEPLSVRYGLGIEQHDHEGRVITLEFPEAGRDEAGDLLRGFECGPPGDRPEESRLKPPECGFY